MKFLCCFLENRKSRWIRMDWDSNWTGDWFIFLGLYADRHPGCVISYTVVKFLLNTRIIMFDSLISNLGLIWICTQEVCTSLCRWSAVGAVRRQVLFRAGRRWHGAVDGTDAGVDAPARARRTARVPRSRRSPRGTPSRCAMLHIPVVCLISVTLWPCDLVTSSLCHENSDFEHWSRTW